MAALNEVQNEVRSERPNGGWAGAMYALKHGTADVPRRQRQPLSFWQVVLAIIVALLLVVPVGLSLSLAFLAGLIGLGS
jgi:hypothetical protein